MWVSTETAAGFLWTKAQSLEERIGWDMCSTDIRILWWLSQDFLLFSDVLRQSYSCLMLSPFSKEAPHIHHARRAPAPFQVLLNTLSWPGRMPDVSQSWTGSLQAWKHLQFWMGSCVPVCATAIQSTLGYYVFYRACLSSKSVWEDVEQRMEIADVLHGLHHRINSCWHGMKRELRFSCMYLTY